MAEMLTTMANLPQYPEGVTSNDVLGFDWVAHSNHKPNYAGGARNTALGLVGLGALAAPAVALGAGETPAPVPSNVDLRPAAVTVTGASAEARAAATVTTRTVLSFRSPNGTPRSVLRTIVGRENKAKCKLDDHFLNSGTKDGDTRNTPTFFPDSRLTILCKSKTSPTGWIKVGLPRNKNVLKDGFQKTDVIPGTDCENIVNPNDKAKVKRIVQNPLLVRSFNETVSVSVAVEAKAECTPDTYAYGRAAASARYTVRQMLRARLSPGGGVVNRLTGKLSTEAIADARCASTVITTPEVKNASPTVDVVDHAETKVGGVTEVCGYVKDPDGLGDIKDTTFTETGVGNFVTNSYEGDEPGEICTKLDVGLQTGEAIVTLTATDKAGNSASDTEKWDVVDPDSTGGPGAF